MRSETQGAGDITSGDAWESWPAGDTDGGAPQYGWGPGCGLIRDALVAAPQEGSYAPLSVPVIDREMLSVGGPRPPFKDDAEAQVDCETGPEPHSPFSVEVGWFPQ